MSEKQYPAAGTSRAPRQRVRSRLSCAGRGTGERPRRPVIAGGSRPWRETLRLPERLGDGAGTSARPCGNAALVGTPGRGWGWGEGRLVERSIPGKPATCRWPLTWLTCVARHARPRSQSRMRRTAWARACRQGQFRSRRGRSGQRIEHRVGRSPSERTVSTCPPTSAMALLAPCSDSGPGRRRRGSLWGDLAAPLPEPGSPCERPQQPQRRLCRPLPPLRRVGHSDAVGPGAPRGSHPRARTPPCSRLVPHAWAWTGG